MTIESLLAIITITSILIGAIWKVALIKEQIQKEFNDEYEKLDNAIHSHETRIALLQNQLESKDKATNERISSLHLRTKSKIQDLIYGVNEVQRYLQKYTHDPNNPHFVIRQREKETLNDAQDEESWTNFG